MSRARPGGTGSREPSQQVVSAASGFDPSRGFNDWWTELEGWSFRCERAVEDLQIEDSNISRLRAWMEAAYLTGLHARDGDVSEVVVIDAGEVACCSLPAYRALVPRDSDGNPEGRDREAGLGAEHDSAVAKPIAQGEQP